VVLPAAGDLAAPQLLATFAGLWHATMRMQQLGYASQADRWVRLVMHCFLLLTVPDYL
jgi:hypothetical protein